MLDLHGRALVSLGCLLVSGCATAFPGRLAGTVHVVEEQGIDYSGTSNAGFVLTLGESGVGRAVVWSHSIGVLGTDLQDTERAQHFSARGTWHGSTLVVTLELAPGEPVSLVDGLTMRCERWDRAERVAADRPVGVDASARTLPGVDWLCELPSDAGFPLGFATVQHFPRSGLFLLLGEAHVAHVEMQVDQGGRAIETRPDDALPAALR